MPWCLRSDGDGGSHDVHHGVPDDRHRGPQGLEAPDLGLRLVVCVGFQTIATTSEMTVTLANEAKYFLYGLFVL